MSKLPFGYIRRSFRRHYPMLKKNNVLYQSQESFYNEAGARQWLREMKAALDGTGDFPPYRESPVKQCSDKSAEVRRERQRVRAAEIREQQRQERAEALKACCICGKPGCVKKIDGNLWCDDCLRYRGGNWPVGYRIKYYNRGII